MSLGEREIEESRRVFDFGAEFGGIATGIDLQEDRQGAAEIAGGAIEMMEKLFAIHTLDTIEVFGGEARFVGLEMADELPLHGGGGLGAFGGGFLHAIFTDGAKAGASDVVGGFRGVGFGDGKESDGGGIASGEMAGRGDLAVNFREPVTKFVISREH